MTVATASDRSATGVKTRPSRPAGAARRILVCALTLATAAVGLAALPAQAETLSAVGVQSWTVVGHGWGHGHGLSQWGAQARAVNGQSYQQILDAYYPGTTPATSANRTLRVALSTLAGSSVTFATAGTSAIAVSTSKNVVRPGQRLLVVRDGAALVATATGGGVAPWRERWTAMPTLSSAESVWVMRADGSGGQYAGAFSLPITSPLTPVNLVSVEAYLKGVVPAESLASWHRQALQAQAVAARSYVLSTLRPTQPWDTCDTTACQVYRGIAGRTASGKLTSHQPASTNAAVSATAGQYRSYRGAPAFTQFSASNGGWSTAGSKPYLVAAPDPYSGARRATSDPVGQWTAKLPVSAVQAKCPSSGHLRSLVITSRDGHGDWGGRVTGLRIVCSTGSVDLKGSAVTFGVLRTSWWTSPEASNPITQRATAIGPSIGARTADVQATSPKAGLYGTYQNGSIYWSATTGAYSVRGPILTSWRRLGAENGALGFPTGEASLVPRKTGTYQFFQNGLMYSSSAGTHAVSGAIRTKYANLGYERSVLGYPTSDAYSVTGGVRSDFQHGSITVNRASGAVTVTTV